MATKTWKIGERCVGGIISVETGKTQVKIINKEYFSGEIISEVIFDIREREVKRKLFMYLTELTTSYHTDMILKWIEVKVALASSNNFFGSRW
jgi:hypothetical protein